MLANLISRIWLHKDINMFSENNETKKEKWEVIKTLRHNDLSNQLTLEICDQHFFQFSIIKSVNTSNMWFRIFPLCQ